MQQPAREQGRKRDADQRNRLANGLHHSAVDVTPLLTCGLLHLNRTVFALNRTKFAEFRTVFAIFRTVFAIFRTVYCDLRSDLRPTLKRAMDRFDIGADITMEDPAFAGLNAKPRGNDRAK
jgi:hypothetical protein